MITLLGRVSGKGVINTMNCNFEITLGEDFLNISRVILANESIIRLKRGNNSSVRDTVVKLYI